MRGLVLARLLESEHERSLRIHSAEYVSNHAVFAGSVKRLENDEKRLAAIPYGQKNQTIAKLESYIAESRGLERCPLGLSSVILEATTGTLVTVGQRGH